MDIIYYLDNFPKLSETFILNEISELEKKGHNIAIFALENTDEELEHEELRSLDAEVYYPKFPDYSDITDLLRSESLNPEFFKTLDESSGLKSKLLQAHRALELIDFIQSINWEPDIIHTHFSTKSKTSVQTVSAVKNIPWAIEVHAYDIFQEDMIQFSKNFLQNPDRIITVSEYNKNYLNEEFRLDKSIDVVPVSVRPEKFRPQGLEEKNKIVSVGRLVEKKGFKYGIEAFAKLKEKHPELQYDIIGKGELRSELEELAEELEVLDDVNFLGHVSDEKLKAEMEEAKAFLLPCVKADNGDLDAMPMVLKEAMALETPCVSTTVSAIPELIEDGKDGLLAEPKDSEELSEKLSELLQSKKTREEMGAHARQKIVKDYDITKNIEGIEKTFRKTIS